MVLLKEGADGFRCPAGHAAPSAKASTERTPGVADRIELDDVPLRKPGRSSAPFSESRSMPDQPKRRERQTAPGKSDRCVVSAKPSNVGGEKAARPSRRTGEPS